MAESDDAGRLERLVERLRALPPVSPDARSRLIDALAREAPAPRLILVTPARAILAAMLLIGLTSATWAWLLHGRSARTPGLLTDLIPVHFVLVDPGARSVGLAGDFNQWDPAATPLTPGEGGIWSVVVPLRSGAVTYSFVVDGRDWKADPAAPLAQDDFGHPSSVVYVAQEVHR